MYYPIMDRYDLGWNFGMGMLWFILLAIIAVVIIRSLRHREWREWYESRGHASAKANPLDIAKERYAKGDITKDEFDQLKKDLQ